MAKVHIKMDGVNQVFCGKLGKMRIATEEQVTPALLASGNVCAKCAKKFQAKSNMPMGATTIQTYEGGMESSWSPQPIVVVDREPEGSGHDYMGYVQHINGDWYSFRVFTPSESMIGRKAAQWLLDNNVVPVTSMPDDEMVELIEKVSQVEFD